MNLNSPLLSPIRPVWARSALLSIIAALSVHQLDAQTSYTAIDLTPTASGSAQTASGGQAAGYTASVPNAFSGKATLWTGDGAIDLHPPFLDGAGARSQVNGFAGNLQVGIGAGTSTGNRNVPLAWSDSAASATLLSIPFVNAGGQANATDGIQIVGSAIGYDRDGTTLSSPHALIWNVATGSVIDIGIAAPLFVLGKDDDAKWKEIRQRPAPWAELACDKMIIICPTEVARQINNPSELMTFWKAVVEAQDEITNQATERQRPERIVADVQISAGYMHSGYPIMIPTSAAPEMTTLTRVKFPGWGFYHEIGHNHQRGTFTFDGTGEVTNNVIGMYCYDAVLKKDWLIGHGGITEESRKDHIKKIKAAKDKWQLWKSDPFLALTTYIQLIQEFGWESWRKYLHSFGGTEFGPEPKGDDDARDQFLIRYSKIANKNLAPFFDFWGIPVSSSAKAEVSKLEPWMPKGL